MGNNNIFGRAGIAYTNEYNNYAYVTVDFDKKLSIYRAPITGIVISQNSDFTILKTLGGGFNILAFGDLPVIIKLSGLRSLGGTQLCKDTEPGQTDVTFQDVFKNYRVGVVGSKQITITMADIMYKGMLISLKQGNSDIDGVCVYDLGIIAVRGAVSANKPAPDTSGGSGSNPPKPPIEPILL